MNSGVGPEPPLYGLFGTGGFGRPVMPILQDMIRERHAGHAEAVFIDDRPPAPEVNGVPVLTSAAFLAAPRATKYFNVALTEPKTRMAVCRRFLDAGLEPVSIVSRTAAVIGPAEIGAGAIICGFVTVTTNVRIGRFFHANIYAYVEHDCIIGDFVTLAPRVNCNGNITIKDFAYIGAAAAIRQGAAGALLVIGRGAVVGMGAVVLNPVADGAVVAGNPAKPIRAGGRRGAGGVGALGAPA
jgi:sugar O-acyltransferase (sialic acid O-acetyltransferase NeuD family)